MSRLLCFTIYLFLFFIIERCFFFLFSTASVNLRRILVVARCHIRRHDTVKTYDFFHTKQQRTPVRKPWQSRVGEKIYFYFCKVHMIQETIGLTIDSSPTNQPCVWAYVTNDTFDLKLNSPHSRTTPQDVEFPTELLGRVRHLEHTPEKQQGVCNIPRQRTTPLNALLYAERWYWQLTRCEYRNVFYYSCGNKWWQYEAIYLVVLGLPHAALSAITWCVMINYKHDESRQLMLIKSDRRYFFACLRRVALHA